MSKFFVRFKNMKSFCFLVTILTCSFLSSQTPTAFQQFGITEANVILPLGVNPPNIPEVLGTRPELVSSSENRPEVACKGCDPGIKVTHRIIIDGEPFESPNIPPNAEGIYVINFTGFGRLELSFPIAENGVCEDPVPGNCEQQSPCWFVYEFQWIPFDNTIAFTISRGPGDAVTTNPGENLWMNGQHYVDCVAEFDDDGNVTGSEELAIEVTVASGPRSGMSLGFLVAKMYCTKCEVDSGN